MWTGLVSYLEIPDKAKWPKLILVSILGRKQHDRKARRGAASTEHWQGILLLHPNLWGRGTRALQPSDLTPAATDLAAAKPVLSVPEFLLQTGIYLLCPCAWAVLISSLQMVPAAPLPLRFPSPGPQPLAGNQNLIYGLFPLSHTRAVSGAMQLPSGHWPPLPASNSPGNYQYSRKTTQNKSLKYTWSTEIEDTLWPWEKTTVIYVLGFTGIWGNLQHISH